VTELPPVPAVVSEGQRHRVVCPACGEVTRAELPAGVPAGEVGTRAPASLASSRRPIRRALQRRLAAGQTCGVSKTDGTCREMLTRRQAWWTFVRHPVVEPTNHAAERAIRPGVLWRTGSFGTQSAGGSHVVEAMITIVATLRPQHRHVLDYRTTASEAALQGKPTPSLRPFPCDPEHPMRLASSLASVGERLPEIMAALGHDSAWAAVA
jgi:hypothetical protein